MVQSVAHDIGDKRSGRCALRGWLPLFGAWLLMASALTAAAASVESYARNVSSLIDPAKLATLGERAANPRVQKYVALLADAKAAGLPVNQVASAGVDLAGMKGEAAKLTAAAMVRNLTIAERLGCLDAEGLGNMRRGKSPIVRRGPYAGDKLSVDHIIPRSIAPELDNVIANLEVMPLKMNKGKNTRIGARQLYLARKLNQAGLLSAEGLRAVEAAGKSG